MKTQTSISHYLLFSITAGILIVLLAFFQPHNVNEITFFEKFVVVVVFTVSCIFGLSLAWYPRWFKKKMFPAHSSHNNQHKHIDFIGHHPNCTKFSQHRLTLHNKTFCAGCLGLSIGALVSVVFAGLYLMRNWFVPYTQVVLIIGLFILFLLYIEILLPKRHPLVHVFCNSILIINFLLITICVVEITKTILYGLLTILLCFLWLDTRIKLSGWQHHNMCKNCMNHCRQY